MNLRYWSENLTANRSPFLAIFCTREPGGKENIEKTAGKRNFLIGKKKTKA